LTLIEAMMDADGSSLSAGMHFLEPMSVFQVKWEQIVQTFEGYPIRAAF
jgi:hypothetical protein